MTEKEELVKKFKEKYGRNPPELSPQKIERLEDGFLDGLNDREACLYAGVCKTDLYYYQEVNPDFAERKELLRNNNTIIGKKHLSTNIRGGDINSIKFWLERRAKDEFSARTESTGKDGESIKHQVSFTQDEIRNMADEMRKK